MTRTQSAQDTIEVAENGPLLQIEDVVKHFPIGGGLLSKPSAVVRAVDGVSLSVRRGETVGLVGESGSGKSTLGRLVLRLLEPTSGTISFDGQDISALSMKAMTPLRRRMQLIFQDPVSSFNPRMNIEDALCEPMRVHRIGDEKSRRKRCIQLLDQVGLPSSALSRYPHQFSGGQAQRIGIARALTTNPDLLVCDEAVSALDVSVQAQVLNLLREVQVEHGLSYLFIAHDLNVVRYISDRVCVMYLGKLAEIGDSDDVMRSPKHPYSKALVDAIPTVDASKRTKRIPLGGEIPSPTNPPSGCSFHTRCPRVFDRCRVDEPQLQFISGNAREVACHLYDGPMPE